MEKSSCWRLYLKRFTQVAARQLKDRSFQIFGALTENALSAMTTCVRTAEQQFVWRSQWTRWRIVTNERYQIRWTSTLPFLVSQKNLSYRRGTAQRAMLVNSCYVSRGMGARKVSNSKSDLQGHSRALAIVPFNKPHTIFYHTSIAPCICLAPFPRHYHLFPKT